jgi:hypothetical protein
MYTGGFIQCGDNVYGIDKGQVVLYSTGEICTKLVEAWKGI